MSGFWLYFNLGLKYVLDINAYTGALLLLALVIPYSFKDWKRVILLLFLFALGYTLSLILSAYQIVFIKESLVKYIIPFAILATALFHLFKAGKTTKKESLTVISFVTIFFGIIHGLSFFSYFGSAITDSASQKILPLIQFVLGILTAQIIIVFVALILSYIVQTFFRFSKRDWTLVASSLIIGVIIPMII
ncbi:MAG: HupE/UreJ family protein [Flavobacteriaceae bacterium]|jgi:hypothetical protein|nr:HupE/UreJ family protein [Flavobacteriaceae bacterium]